LAVKELRVCQKCGKGRAALVADDGTLVTIPLDRTRAHELSTDPDEHELRSLTELLLEQMLATGTTVEEVVLDIGPAGVRALLSLTNEAGHTEVVAATPQAGIGLVVRGGFKLYATPEVLAGSTDTLDAPDPGETVH
jgi:hypothetical protein